MLLKHGNHIIDVLPGFGRSQIQLLKDVLAIEQHRKGLLLRKGIHSPVVLVRRKSAVAESRSDFIEIGEARQVSCSPSHRIVHWNILANLHRHIRPFAGKRSREKDIGRNEPELNRNIRTRRKGIINQALQYLCLIAAGCNPDCDRTLLLLGIAYAVIILAIGGRKGAELMAHLFKNSCLCPRKLVPW
ncbi:hypothetical protein D3C78_1389520 [compost metagenome]